MILEEASDLPRSEWQYRLSAEDCLHRQDCQREAVYAWEDEVCRRWSHLNPLLTRRQCRVLIKRVWRDHCQWWRATSPPHISFPTNGKATGGLRRICLPAWAMERLVVLHEVAHSLACEHHGPKFARFLVELWVRYARVPRVAVMRMPRRQSPPIRFASAMEVPRPTTRQWRRWGLDVARAREAQAVLYLTEPRRHII